MKTLFNKETPIDVSRDSILRLRAHALEILLEAEDGTFHCSYWEGYQRALEEVIAMEGQ